jgi:NTF2 fold immunity protein
MKPVLIIDFSSPESVVSGFIATMHQWELDSANEMNAASTTDDPASYQEIIMQTLADVFLKYCTVRERKYGRLGSFQMPPEYDPAKEKILSIAIDEKKKTATVETQRDGMWIPEKYQYILFFNSNKWLIDNQKTEHSGKWKQNIL